MASSSFTVHLPTIPSQDFTKEKLVGKGGFGAVYQGTWRGAAIAVKELFLQSISTKEFENEATVMFRCQHRNITRLYGVCLEEGKFALIMKYLEKGNLMTLLHNPGLSLPWTYRYSLATDIGEGLSYLHSQKVTHGDLKSLNVLVAKNGRAKITDFGLAKVRLETSSKISPSSEEQQGSIRWMAPELFSPEGIANAAADLYSFGVILWEIASRQAPFSQAKNNDIIIIWKRQRLHEKIPADCPAEYGKLIEKCWKEPDQRPSAEAVTKELTLLQQKVESFRLQHLVPQTPEYVSNSLEKGVQKLSLSSKKTSGESHFQRGRDLYFKGHYKEALPELQKAAEAGNSFACVYLVLLFSRDDNGLKDPKESQKWEQKVKLSIESFIKQAEQGHSEAQLVLGICYQNGLGVSKDFNKAVYYLELAANQGNAGAQFSLGFCYYNGQGVSQDFNKAVHYFELAANQGHAGAQFNLGACYKNGKGVSQDFKKAVYYYELAANQGNAYAQHGLGFCYENGQGVTQDFRKAAYYYELAANQGDAYAQFSLGLCYYNGQGVSQDFNKAAYYYELAANQGYMYAQYNLGVCYYNGQGVIQDFRKAVYYYELAANQGNATAQFNLGVCYENGRGVSKDFRKAAYYYELAARQGYASATQRLQWLKQNYLT